MASPQPPAARPAPRFSDAIAIARVMCGFGIIYVHAWTGLTGDVLVRMAGTGQDALRWTLMELLGRGAVPLLSLVSGWLLAGGRSQAKPYGRFLRDKARVILLPMICWNALASIVVSGAAALGIIQAPTPHSLWWLVDELFCLVTPNDINVQTAFLRDLFVCMAIAPLLLRATTGWLIIVAALAAVWTIGGWDVPLLLRPQILTFFALGMLLRRTGGAEAIDRLPFFWAVAPALLIVPVKIAVEVIPATQAVIDPRVITAIDLLLRVAMAVLFWRIAWMLAGSRWSARLVALERYVFFTFCAHLILIWLGGPLIGGLTGPLGSPLYPAYLLVQPVLAFGACIGLALLLTTWWPAAAGVLSGGRLIRPRSADARPAAVAARR